MNVLDLFSGIGGFSLGLERAGMRTVAFCEIEPYCRAVLRKHWPNVPIFEDIRTLTADDITETVDVICGGFPCQDISGAGAQAGLNQGTRSGLWSELVRLIDEIRPQYAIVENVTNLLNGPSEQHGKWFGRVLGDLAEIGYDAEWECIFSQDVGVPQSRPRVYIVAYPSLQNCKPLFSQIPEHVEGYRAWLDAKGGEHADLDNENSGSCTLSVLGNIEWAAVPNRERSGNNERLSLGLDRYKGLGNSVTPQIPEIIGKAIMQQIHGG